MIALTGGGKQIGKSFDPVSGHAATRTVRPLVSDPPDPAQDLLRITLGIVRLEILTAVISEQFRHAASQEIFAFAAKT